MHVWTKTTEKPDLFLSVSPTMIKEYAKFSAVCGYVCLNCFEIGIDVIWHVCVFNSATFSHAGWLRWTSGSAQSFCSHVMSLHLSACYCSGSDSPNLTVKPDYYVASVGKIRLSGSRHGKSTLFVPFFGHLPFRIRGRKLTHTLFILVKQTTCFIGLCSTRKVFFFFLNEPVTQT